MIGRLNHAAIVVSDPEAASATYRQLLDAKASEPVDVTEHDGNVDYVEQA